MEKIEISDDELKALTLIDDAVNNVGELIGSLDMEESQVNIIITMLVSKGLITMMAISEEVKKVEITELGKKVIEENSDRMMAR